MSWLRDSLYFRRLALICALAIAPGGAFLYGQSLQPAPTTGNQQQNFVNPQQLESLVAPIALYPDALLALVLAASTYPLQIVTADRWVQQNSNLKGKALVEAAGMQDWDPSIQALAAFPTVLQMMDQNLEWTTALGNAFLAQQADVMAAVQRMRMKAEQAGKLQSTPQQKVENQTVDGQSTIVIESADPYVIYVPTYSTTYVYESGSSGSDSAAAAAVISFGLGVAVGELFNDCCGGYRWGWGCRWGHYGSVTVNNNYFNNNGNTFANRGNDYRGNGQAAWNHNPQYRGAVPYPNGDVANRFNGGQGGLRAMPQPSNMVNLRPPGSLGSTKPAAPGGRWGEWGGANSAVGNRGGAFPASDAGQARAFSDRGARSLGGGFPGGPPGGGFRPPGGPPGGGFHPRGR